MTAPILAPHAAAGDAAGVAGEAYALAAGTLASGVVAVQTSNEPEAGSVAGSLLDVTLSVDGDDFPVSTAFTATQITGTGLPSLATTVVQRPGYGFSIMPTVAAAPNTLYVFSYTG
jgi:hypothetical protein